MKRPSPSRAAGCFLVLGAMLGCRYSLNPDIDPNVDGGGFTCADDGDCGGGWHCNLACSAAGFAPYCLPNSECDPCPDFQSDPANCGGCGDACGAQEVCISGDCVSPSG